MLINVIIFIPVDDRQQVITHPRQYSPEDMMIRNPTMIRRKQSETISIHRGCHASPPGSAFLGGLFMSVHHVGMCGEITAAITLLRCTAIYCVGAASASRNVITISSGSVP
jgi:hypothetical protein